MKSKYSGKCRRCQTHFSVGTEIISDGGSWHPVDCEGCAKQNTDLTVLLCRQWDSDMGNHKFMDIECVSGFEIGGAHETIGTEWRASLYDVTYHYMSNSGWAIGTGGGKGMSFTGKSLMDVVSRVHSFLMWYNENKEPEQNTAR